MKHLPAAALVILSAASVRAFPWQRAGRQWCFTIGLHNSLQRDLFISRKKGGMLSDSSLQRNCCSVLPAFKHTISESRGHNGIWLCNFWTTPASWVICHQKLGHLSNMKRITFAAKTDECLGLVHVCAWICLCVCVCVEVGLYNMDQALPIRKLRPFLGQETGNSKDKYAGLTARVPLLEFHFRFWGMSNWSAALSASSLVTWETAHRRSSAIQKKRRCSFYAFCQ